MKTTTNLSLVLILLFTITCFSCSKEKDIESLPFSKKISFYYRDSIIHRDINSQMILVKFNESDYSKDQAITILEQYPEIDLEKSAIGDYFRPPLTLKSGITETEYLGLLKKLNSIISIDYATPSYLIDGPGIGFLTNKFFILPTMSETEFEVFLTDNSSRFSMVIGFPHNALFTVDNMEDGFEAMNLANEINVLDGIDYSQPSFSTYGVFYPYMIELENK